jgi:hypothetical protein
MGLGLEDGLVGQAYDIIKNRAGDIIDKRSATFCPERVGGNARDRDIDGCSGPSVPWLPRGCRRTEFLCQGD